MNYKLSLENDLLLNINIIYVYIVFIICQTLS